MIQLLIIHLTRSKPQLVINKRLSLTVQQVNIIRLKPHLKDIVLHPRMTERARLDEHGLAKLFIHPFCDPFGHSHIFIGQCTGNDQMTTEFLLTFGIGPILELFHSRELITPLLTLLTEFAFECLVLLHKLFFEGPSFVRGGRAVLGIEGVVARFEILTVKEQIIHIFVVHLIHPIFQSEHLTFLVIHGGSVQRNHSRLGGILLGDVIVPDPLVVPKQLVHVGDLDIVPRPFKVLGTLFGIALVHFQLRHPLREHNGRLGMVLKAGQDQIRHVEVEVIHEPHFRLGTGHGVGILNHVEDFVLGFVGEEWPIFFDVHVGHGVVFAKVGLVVQFCAGGLVGSDFIVEFDQVLFGKGPVGRVAQILSIFLDIAGWKGIGAMIIGELSGIGNGLWINHCISSLILNDDPLQILLRQQHVIILAHDPLHLLQIHITFQLGAFFLRHLIHNVIHRFGDIFCRFKVAWHNALAFRQLFSFFHLG
mmetsp:Transcript_41874/g.75456  ORF Transcript_41874/g.75456 Transcript_41874/m.75456 type:complete len:477 (+) Transcript_41874:176-1606(+)